MAQELYAKIGEGSADLLFFFFSPSLLPPPTTKGAEGESWQRHTLRGSISVTWDYPIQILAPTQSKISKFLFSLSWPLLQNTDWSL
jgi:hypothetical protein